MNDYLPPAILDISCICLLESLLRMPGMPTSGMYGTGVSASTASSSLPPAETAP